MSVLRGAYWLALWLLSPSRGALMLKCVFIGVVLKLLSLVVIIPAAVLMLLGDDPGLVGPGPETAQAALLRSPAGIAYIVLGGPLVETIMVTGVFGLLTRVLGLPAIVSGIVVVVGAVLLHRPDFGDDPLALGFVAFMFTAFSVQYTLSRAHIGASTTILGIAVTHGTINMIGVAISLAAQA